MDNIKVDAVITWVDGNDEKHRTKMLPYLDDVSKINSIKLRTRYDHVNEIKYTVDSILKFAPFIRKIFILTDNQIPIFLKKSINNKRYRKIKVVDHQEIFEGYERYLPTFNSISIETAIFKIKDLSEHFIYFNDDIFLTNPTVPTDFFKNGLPILRGKWLQFDNNRLIKKYNKKRIGHKNAQQLAAQIIGFEKYYRFKHTPHPIRKSTLQSYFDEHSQLFKENIKYRFRNPKQFIPQGMANHLEIKNNNCYLEKDFNLVYIRSYNKPLSWYKFKMNIMSKKKLFLGLQSLDQSPQHILSFLLHWLKNRVT